MADRVVLGSAVLELTSDDAKLMAGLRRTRGEAEGILTGIGKTAIGVSAGILGAQALGGVFGFIKNELIGTGFGFNALKERATIAFTTILKDGEQARVFLEDLEAFAKRTPFEFPDLVTGSQRLLALGFSAEQVIPLLTAVGDAAAGLGSGAEGIDRITRALGQMQARGKTSAEEMLQLAEAGVPAWELLANKIGVSIPEAMDRVTKGQVAAGVTIEAVINGINERFGGMMTQQSTGWDGLLATLKDTWRSISGTVMKPFFDRAKTGLKTIVDITNAPEFTEGVEEFADVLDDKLGDSMEWLEQHGPGIARGIGEAWEDAVPAIRTAADKAGDLKETLEDISDSPAIEITFDVAVLGLDQLVGVQKMILGLPADAMKAAGFVRDRIADAEALLRGGLQGGIPGMFGAAAQRARVAQRGSGSREPEGAAPSDRGDSGVSFFDRVSEGIATAVRKLEAGTRPAFQATGSNFEGLGDAAEGAGEDVKTAAELILEQFDAIASRAPRAMQPLLDKLQEYRQKAVDANDFGTVALIDGLLAVNPTTADVSSAIGALTEMYGELEAGMDAVLGKLEEQASRAPHTMAPLRDELELYRQAAADAGDATSLDLIEKLLSLDPTADQVRAAIGSLAAVYGDLKQAAADAAREQEELARSLEEVRRMGEQALATLRQDVTGQLDFLGDAITTALRRQYQQQLDASLAAIDAERTVLESASEARLAQIQRSGEQRLAAEQAASEARLALLEREADRAKSLLEAQTAAAIAPLQAQIDALEALDRADKAADYERQLADIERQIGITYDPRKVEELEERKADILRQMARDERREQVENLRDQIRTIEDNAREQQRILEDSFRAREQAERDSARRREDALRESIKRQEDAERAALAKRLDALERQAERARETFEAQTADYKLQAEARTLLLNGEMDKAVALLERHYPEWRTAGLSFGQQMIDGLRTSNVEGEIQRILGMFGTLTGTGTGPSLQDLAADLASIARLVQGGAPAVAINAQRAAFQQAYGFASPLATGGLITSPTLALLGETSRARPEIVSPEYLMRRVVREESGGGRGDIYIDATVEIGGEVIDERVDVRVRSIQERQRRAAQLSGIPL